MVRTPPHYSTNKKSKSNDKKILRHETSFNESLSGAIRFLLKLYQHGREIRDDCARALPSNPKERPPRPHNERAIDKLYVKQAYDRSS